MSLLLPVSPDKKSVSVSLRSDDRDLDVKISCVVLSFRVSLGVEDVMVEF